MTNLKKYKQIVQSYNWLLPPLVLGALLFATTCGSRQEVASVPASARLIDVRTPGEFADRHHPGAENILLDQIEADPNVVGDKAQEIIVYCRSGRRSTLAKELLEQAGFNNVKNGGGLDQLCKVSGACL